MVIKDGFSFQTIMSFCPLGEAQMRLRKDTHETPAKENYFYTNRKLHMGIFFKITQKRAFVVTSLGKVQQTSQ